LLKKKRNIKLGLIKKVEKKEKGRKKDME